MKKILFIIIFVISVSYMHFIDNEEIDIKKGNIVENNLYNCGGTYKIEDYFDAHFLLRDYNNNHIPLLLHLAFDYNEKSGDRISDSIENVYLEFNGINGKVNVLSVENKENHYIVNIDISKLKNRREVVKSKNQEAEIAFLKNKFYDEVLIKKIDDKNIIYQVDNAINHYQISLDFIKDDNNDELKLTIKDRGDTYKLNNNKVTFGE